MNEGDCFGSAVPTLLKSSFRVVRVFETITSAETRITMMTKVSAELRRAKVKPDGKRGDAESGDRVRSWLRVEGASASQTDGNQSTL
jgi:hypothetical protein